MSPSQIPYAVANHLKRELDLTDKAIGTYVIRCFGKSTPEYVQERGPVETWKTVEEFVDLVRLERAGAIQTSAAAPGNGSDTPAIASDGANVTTDTREAPPVKPEPATAPRTANETPTAQPEEKPVRPFPIKPALSSAWTEVRINGHNITVTAYEGQSAQAIAANVFALIEALQIVKADKRVEECAPVIDRRDSAVPTKANGEAVSEQAPAPVSANEGTSDCFMIKVGKTFKGDKDQIQFEVAGVTDDVKFSSQKIEALVKTVAGLRKPDGTPITATDLTNGAKLPVRGKVVWKRSDDGNFINVIRTEAA